MVRRSLENHDHSSTGNGGRQIKPDIVEVANSLGIPVESADADADNERLYYNSNDNTIKYKDSAGNVFSGAQGDVNNPMTANLDADGNNISNVGSLSTGDLDTDRSWTDVTSSRSLDTQETNDTDSEIKAVVVVAPDADGTVVNIQGVIGGSGSFGGKKHDTRDTSQDLSIYLQSIPPNTTYQVVSFGDTSDYSLAFWGEYR